MLAAAAAGGGVTLAILLLTRGGLDFLAGQRNRGVEFESVAATPFMIARQLEWWRGTLDYRYGSVEVIGAHVGQAANLAVAASVLSIGWLLLWRWRRWRSKAGWRPETVADAALAATLLMVVTSRVVSPQYLVWVLGLAACCLAFRGTSQRGTAVLVLVATALTYLEYPVLWFEMVGGVWYAIGVLVLRNAVLVAAALWACWRLWRSTVTTARVAAPADGPGAPADGPGTPGNGPGTPGDGSGADGGSGAHGGGAGVPADGSVAARDVTESAGAVVRATAATGAEAGPR
jgi:hypothetical protein